MKLETSVSAGGMYPCIFLKTNVKLPLRSLPICHACMRIARVFNRIGLLLLLTNERGKGKVVNVGNPEEVTILELAQKIEQLAGSTSPMTFHPLPVDDPRRRCPDIGRAEKLLGWKPKISLKQGLARTITWFQRKRA